VLGLVKPGQLLSHLLRYSPVLKRYSIPFPLGGEAEQFLLQRYQQLMVPGRTAAGGSVDGEDEGLLGVEGLELSRAPAATAAGPAAAGAPELDTRLALPGLSLATWSAGRLLWALYYLTLVVSPLLCCWYVQSTPLDIAVQTLQLHASCNCCVRMVLQCSTTLQLPCWTWCQPLRVYQAL
jgi:hypothetical protein